MGETVVLYSLAAILSACVAALGFKISDKSKGGISITKMAEDLAKSAVPGFKVILGTAAMALDPGAFYAYMQIVNGKTSVPQSLISWVNNWLNEHDIYDEKSTSWPDYTVGSKVSNKHVPYNKLYDVLPVTNEYFDALISKYSLDTVNHTFGLRARLIKDASRLEYDSYVFFDYGIVNDGFVGTENESDTTPNPFFALTVEPGSSTRYPDKIYVARVYKTGYVEFTEPTSSMGRINLELITTVSGSFTQYEITNFGEFTVSGNDTGFEAGENVPGKDVVIPGEGTGTLTNEDIVGWLQSAVGAAVASALGIGTATIPFVPVAVKNPAMTGDITDALDNVIDQVQDIAQAGATDIDTVATGDKYANISLAPSKPSGNISASSLYTIWNPSQAQLNNLARFLWSTDFVDTIKKILQSPMDALISLALFPVKPPTDGTHNISLGYIDSGVSALRVSDQFMTVQTSGLVVPHKYNSYLDYAPYTRAEIFLPFIGFCPLNINDIMGKSVDVTYNIDLLSGVCTAIVHANAQSLYSYSGNMAMFLPLSAGNWARMLTPIFGMVGGVASLGAGIGGVMSGAPLLPSTGMAVRGAESIGSIGGNSVSRSGSISGNAGIMGDYQPFIVVTRPINDKPATYDSNIGQTYNKSAQLGTLSGFTVIEEAHIEGMNATDAEKQEIERLLKEGVIL